MSRKVSIPSVLLLVASIVSACGSEPHGTHSDPDSSDAGTQGAIHPETIEEGRTDARDALASTMAASLSLAVIADGQVAWAETFGVADPSTGAAPTTETQYGIGSISKMFATVAVMKLVDQGKVSLDSPVVAYVPSFAMLSPEYRDITVRMLLNHSSGLPGTTSRNLFTTVPYPSYAEDLLLDLPNERLIFKPGYLNVYTNNGFTMVENLVRSVTGKSYVDYVTDEIFKPLGMDHTAFATAPFPPGTFAHTNTTGSPDPQEFVNAYATGGIYSTPTDLGRFALMLLGKGALGSTRILSEASVEAMAVDQTVSSFNPVPSDSGRFGLGWDTVTEPGLAVVGIAGWEKGGDSANYGADLMLAPTEGLAAIVMGTRGISSGTSATLDERMLLRELTARKRIAGMPPVLPKTPAPAITPTPAQIQAMTGIWSRTPPQSLLRVDAAPDGSLSLSEWDGSSWQVRGRDLRLRSDGVFQNDTSTGALFPVSAGGRDYLGLRAPGGYGEFLQQTAFAQRVGPRGTLSPAWQARLGHTWVEVNMGAHLLSVTPVDPRIAITEVPGLEGQVVVREPAPDAEKGYYVLDPSQSDTSALVMLRIPSHAGRDLDDLDVVSRGGEEWLQLGSLVCRPVLSIPVINPGQTESIDIGPEGYAEWRLLQAPTRVTVTTQGAWKLFDPNFTLLQEGDGQQTLTLPSGTQSAYLEVFGASGERIEIASAP